MRNAARTSSAGSGVKHVVLGRQASRSPTLHLHMAHGGQFWWGCHAHHLMMTGLPTCARRLQREVVSVGGGIAAAWCLQHIAAHPRLRSGRHRACPHRRCQRCRTVAVAAQRPPPMCLPAQRLRKSAPQCLPPQSLLPAGASTRGEQTSRRWTDPEGPRCLLARNSPFSQLTAARCCSWRPSQPSAFGSQQRPPCPLALMRVGS